LRGSGARWGWRIDAREPHLAKAAVCAKLILAILAESLLARVLALSPTG
jgi:hypothetical protein